MLNCGATNEINGDLFPNFAFNIETRLKGVYKICSFNLSDYKRQIRSRNMSRDYFSQKSHFLSPFK